MKTLNFVKLALSILLLCLKTESAAQGEVVKKALTNGNGNYFLEHASVQEYFDLKFPPKIGQWFKV